MLLPKNRLKLFDGVLNGIGPHEFLHPRGPDPTLSHEVSCLAPKTTKRLVGGLGQGVRLKAPFKAWSNHMARTCKPPAPKEIDPKTFWVWQKEKLAQANWEIERLSSPYLVFQEKKNRMKLKDHWDLLEKSRKKERFIFSPEQEGLSKSKGMLHHHLKEKTKQNI